MKGKLLKIFSLSSLLLLSKSMAFANEAHPNKTGLMASEITDPLAVTLIIIILLLLGIIIVLGRVVLMSVGVFQEKRKTKTLQSKITKSLLLGFGFSLMATTSMNAQEAVVDSTQLVDQFSMPATIGTLSAPVFGTLMGIIFLEVIVILFLVKLFGSLFFNKKKAASASQIQKQISWIDKVNASTVSKGMTDEEASMGHNFDGIEELDNPTPPWWRLMFVLSVLFGIIYLWRYEIAATAPGQIEELAIETEQANIAKQLYLSKSANNIDENNVVYLQEQSDLDAGKAIFIQMCAACHLEDGGGSVGPNLTDDYWLHGGSIQDIFKTVKYGVPEKGMKSWKDDYSPKQLAQIVSFVKSLQGSKPTNPKEAQGEQFIETSAATTAPIDSVVVPST